MARVLSALTLAALLVVRPALADDPPAPADDRSYTVRLADLERRIEELKTRIRTHRRPVRPFSVTLTSNTSGTFVLERATVTVDGAATELAPIAGIANETFALELYPAPESAHEVKVSLHYRGHDPVFTYLQGYTFDVHAERIVMGTRDLNIVVYEGGGATTPLAQRLRVAFSP